MYAENHLTDPYEILEHYYNAIGGLEKLKAEKSSYFEGSVVMESSGLHGTIKRWEEHPLRERVELDFAVFKRTSGDNGQFSWVIDPNGKLQIQKDETTIQRRSIKYMKEMYFHMDRNSNIFALIIEDIKKLGTVDCYVIKTINNINKDITLDYYNTSSYLLEKTIRTQPEMETHTVLSDYRNVDGIKRPFRQETEILQLGQKQIMLINKSESNIEIETSLFDPPEQDIKDFQFVNGESSEDIPFQLIEDLIFIPVTIYGKEKLWLIDSGAEMSVIDLDYANEIGLQSLGYSKIKGAGNTAEISIVKIPDYHVPGIKFNEQINATANIHELFHKLIGLDVIGILGYDFLSRFVTKIDYADKSISFYQPEKYEYKGNGKLIDAPLKGRLFSIEMKVDDKYSGRWILDIGSGGTYFNYPFAYENNMFNISGIDGISFGLGGEFNQRTVCFNAIELAGLIVQKPLITIPLEKGVGTLNRQELIGVVGNTFSRHFVIYLDYKHQQVIFEKGRDFDRRFPVDKSGLQVILSENEEIEVYFVALKTAAEVSGFKKGDIIKSVNNIGIDYFGGINAFRELMQKESGTEYKFLVLRNDKEKELELKLQDLY